MLVASNVKPFTFPPHPSNLSQPVDLTTLDALKMKKQDAAVRLPDRSQVWQGIELMKALEHSMDSSFTKQLIINSHILLQSPNVIVRWPCETVV
jgi:hypothetical protein